MALSCRTFQAPGLRFEAFLWAYAKTSSRAKRPAPFHPCFRAQKFRFADHWKLKILAGSIFYLQFLAAKVWQTDHGNDAMLFGQSTKLSWTMFLGAVYPSDKALIFRVGMRSGTKASKLDGESRIPKKGMT